MIRGWHTIRRIILVGSCSWNWVRPRLGAHIYIKLGIEIEPLLVKICVFVVT